MVVEEVSDFCIWRFHQNAVFGGCRVAHFCQWNHHVFLVKSSFSESTLAIVPPYRCLRCHHAHLGRHHLRRARRWLLQQWSRLRGVDGAGAGEVALHLPEPRKQSLRRNECWEKCLGRDICPNMLHVYYALYLSCSIFWNILYGKIVLRR